MTSPVTKPVVPQGPQPFGDLLITLTKDYEFRWNDSKTGASTDVGFWHPKPQVQGTVDMRPLGSVVVNHHNDLNDMNLSNIARATLLVGNNVTAKSGQIAAVAAPIDYDRIYIDTKSGARYDGAIWRPKAPDGYVALGDVVSRQKGYPKPGVDEIWCIREDLVTQGIYEKTSLWTDRNSGARDNIAVWAVVPRDLKFDANKVALDASTFIGVSNYDNTPATGLAKVLLIDAAPGINPKGLGDDPVLKDRVQPAQTTAEQRDRWVTLPFTCVLPANDKEALENIASPWVNVERWGFWELAIFASNATDRDQTRITTKETGVTKEQSQTMTHTIGVTIGAESSTPVSKYSVQLNYQFAYSTTTGTSNTETTTVTYSLTTGPGQVGALWVRHYVFRLTRLATDSQIGDDMPFTVNSSIDCQFPPPAPGEFELSPYIR